MSPGEHQSTVEFTEAEMQGPLLAGDKAAAQAFTFRVALSRTSSADALYI